MRINEVLSENLEEGWKEKAAAAALAAGVGAGGLAYKYYPELVSKPYKTIDQEVRHLVTRQPEAEDARSPKFAKRLKEVADALGVSATDLLKVMWLETRGTLDPSKINKIGATGLIQFMPNTAKGLGTTTEELSKMSATKQLDYVLKYFKIKKLPPGSSASDIYLTTFMPAVVTHNKPDDFVLGAKGQYKTPIFKSIPANKLNRGSVWDQNPVFYENPAVRRQGYFTVGDVRDVFDKRSAPVLPYLHNQ